MKMQVQTSGKVSGVVSGRFTNVNANEFLEALRAAYGIRYYKIDNTLFFYHESEWAQKVLHPGFGSDAKTLASQLKDSGMVPEELPVKVQGGGKLLVLQGPPSLTRSLETMVMNFENSPHVKHVMEVFKLKHAKAADRQVSVMDKNIVIPGVASILQAMVTGENAQKGKGAQVSDQSASVSKLMGSGLSAQGKEAKQDGDKGGDKPAADVSKTRGSPDVEPVSIIADNRLNAVVVNDLPYKMPYYKKIIAELDQPVKLVEIHAAIVDVDVDFSKNLGIDWQATRHFSKMSIGGGVGQSANAWDVTTNPFIPNTTAGSGIFSTVFNTARTNFFATINMLETDKKARTLGMPSVLTFDNVEATLEDTTTNYISVKGNEAVDLFKVESGTILQVTPHIIEDPKGGAPSISLQVNIQSNQSNNNSSTSSLVGDQAIPPIKQTKIHTQALVKQGQSLLLGGYYVEVGSDTSNGVPGAKDISFFGRLFGTDEETKNKRERLILITPKVLELGEMQQMPDHLDNPNFSRNPTQDTFLSRPVKPQNSSGCSSNRASNGN
ncbi:MAG: type III secretion system outer membrane ring subunit SctC [Succinivibrio sp.]|nr:type III secretion system outer membrane ring subunit SctC [Succinivibrio sp.]